LSPDWRDDAGGPLASFPLYADKHAKVGRAQFVLDTNPSSHKARLTLRVSICADLDLADGRHKFKLQLSDRKAAPTENVIEIHVTPLLGGVSFSEARRRRGRAPRSAKGTNRFWSARRSPSTRGRRRRLKPRSPGAFGC
jgi:hypothetical protein